MGAVNIFRNGPRVHFLRASHPTWMAALALCISLLLWCLAWYSISSQIGKPFPGFFYNPERVVSSFTPEEFSGWQAGLRPRDKIIAVNGEHWREMPWLVREAGSGEILTYTVERDQQQLEIAVPTMVFSRDIPLRFLPGYLISSLVFLFIGVYVFLSNPTAPINRYLLAYLLVWAVGGSIVWESFLSQNKWMAYLLLPYAVTAPVAGWIFFWSFPADAPRRLFLSRWPIIRILVIVAAVTIGLMSLLRMLADITDSPALWRTLVFLNGWPYFIIFCLGSLPIKSIPLIAIILRKRDRVLRLQATVMLIGLLAGLSGWYLFLWIPASIHIQPIAQNHWGGLIPALYPISIGYAILRYRLLDIRVFIRKGLIYSLLTTFLTAAFILFSLLSGYLFHYTTGRQSLLSMILPALLVAFLFQPVRNRVQHFVDRSFFRREYEIRHTLTLFSESLSMLRDKSEVIQLVRHTIMTTLGARTCLWLPEDDHFASLFEYGGSTRSLSMNSPLVQFLQRERRELFPLSEDPAPEAVELREFGGVLAIPLCTGEKLTGILTLEDRSSGTSYSQEDLELLSMLANSTALALENARLHEEKLEILRQQFFQEGAIQEEERRRIARELHDGVGPSLASLNIRLQTLRKQLEREANPAALEMKELGEQAQQNIRDVRRLIYDLRPAALDQMGLIPAFEEYAARFQKDHGIEITLQIADSHFRLPPDLETTLFRISQEALTNVARHAHASQIEMRVEHTPNEVVLQILDNGQGFDPQASLSGNHLGLWSMQKRVEQFGGCFIIQSQPGMGACVTVKIPIRKEYVGDMLSDG
jgi:signal transduction histidine kinase